MATSYERLRANLHAVSAGPEQHNPLAQRGPRAGWFFWNKRCST